MKGFNPRTRLEAIVAQISSFLFRSVVLVCMSLQLVQIITEYQEYQVRTRVAPFIRGDVHPSSIAFCIEYMDLIDPEYLPHNETLTQRQIMDMTPEAKHFVKAVEIRDDDSLSLRRVEGDEISSYFVQEKFTVGYFVCYDTMATWNSAVSVESVATTPFGTGIFMTLFVNVSTLITRSRQYKVVLHKSHLPFFEFSVSPLMTRRPEASDPLDQVPNNWAQASTQIWESEALVAPYESDCFDYKTIGFACQDDCRHSCIKNRTILEFKKLPISVLVNESVDLPLISRSDEKKKGLVATLKRIEDECGDMCYRNDCKERVILTKVTAIASRDFGVSLVVPDSVCFRLTTRVNLSLSQFLFYVMGIIGTYTGLSVLSFEPKNLWRRLSGCVTRQKERQESEVATSRCCACSQAEATIMILRQIRQENASRRRRRVQIHAH